MTNWLTNTTFPAFMVAAFSLLFHFSTVFSATKNQAL